MSDETEVVDPPEWAGGPGGPNNDLPDQIMSESEYTELVLRSWGLSGEPLRWADVGMQPVISAIRMANTGFASLGSVQEVLDATYGTGTYDAADVALAHVPSAEFVIAAGDIDPDVDPDVDDYIDIIRVDLAADEDLGLPNENVVWDFGDGTPRASDAYGWEHGYREPGVYTVTCTIPVAGVLYSTAQEYTVGEPEADPVTNNPAYLERPATTFDEGEEPPMGNAFPDEPVNPSEPAEAEGPYNPADHTVDEVLAYAAEHPDEVEAIYDAEAEGKNRSTLLDKLA